MASVQENSEADKLRRMLDGLAKLGNDHATDKTRKELRWLLDMLNNGHMKTSEDFLRKSRKGFEDRLLRLGILI